MLRIAHGPFRARGTRLHLIPDTPRRHTALCGIETIRSYPPGTTFRSLTDALVHPCETCLQRLYADFHASMNDPHGGPPWARPLWDDGQDAQVIWRRLREGC